MDWNEMYATEQTPWDKGMPTPVLSEILARYPDSLSGNVLVPGCGLGHDALQIAKLGHQVTAADISSLALEKARALDTENLVNFIESDILNPSADQLSSFDAIWEHTCLCALDPDWRKDYVKGLRSMLKPDGHVVGVFFINPEMDPGETGPPFGISQEELTLLWQSVGLSVVDAWVPETGYPGRIGRELAMVLHLDTAAV